MANGNTDFATIKTVTVVRPDFESYLTYKLDLNSKDIFLSEGFYLRPNDYVVVQPDKNKNFQLNSQAYSLVFSSLSMLMTVLVFAIK